MKPAERGAGLTTTQSGTGNSVKTRQVPSELWYGVNQLQQYGRKGNTNLRLVNSQVGAVGPLETLFIEEGQVVLCRQVLGLNESAEQG